MTTSENLTAWMAGVRPRLYSPKEMRLSTERRRFGLSRGDVLVRARALVEALDRHAPTRAGARAAARALTHATLRRLSAEPGVRAAFARGSHGRGDFVPFASDLDLAVHVRESGRGPTFDAALGLVRALAHVRRWNPLLRDPWQMIVGDTEWPLVERYWSLFQLDDWRDIAGRPPSFTHGPVDEGLALAARWNRQHLWTDSALRHVVTPVGWTGEGALAFAAAEKKALSFAAVLAGGSPPRRRQPPPSEPEEAFERAAELVARLEASALLVATRAGLAPSDVRSLARPPVADDERALVAALARRSSRLPPLAGAVLHSGMVSVVTKDATMPPERLVGLLRDLVLVAHETGKRLFLYSPLSFPLAPIYEELRVLDVAPATTVAVGSSATLATPPPPDPLLLREQLFYEALFTGTELRTTAARAASDPGLAYLTRRLARLLAYFETGRLVRGGSDAVAVVRRVRPELDALLDREPGDRRERFATNAALFVALVAALDRSPA
jgi:predicted nucleotidyltransferase